ncbi:MAG TPA: hypothetical protein VFH80_21305 [Solirubrobacteraceae bacterium]|nr:hypothetical protein [Solirubrobacteraceae bacterium]
MATLASALLLALTGFAPHYHLVGHHGVATDGRYTVLWSVHRGEVGTFIDEQTGRRRRLMLPAGCRSGGRVSPILDDSWLLADCGPARVELYSPASHVWRAVTVAAVCRRGCVPLAVGTDWIEYDKQSVRRGDRFIFQNIATGAVLGDPANTRTLPDLDSPALAQPVCAPLRVPRHGKLTFDGRFAVAVGPTGTFIERCGTHLRVPVPSENVAAAPGSLVWLTSATEPVSGVFLPSLRRFTVAAPPVHAYLVDVELSVRHIYVTVATGGGGADVWSAPAP